MPDRERDDPYLDLGGGIRSMTEGHPVVDVLVEPVPPPWVELGITWREWAERLREGEQ